MSTTLTILSRNSYGKSQVRLTKVNRLEDRHDLKEVTIDVELEGDFEAAYTAGDNSLVVATDSMKNTVYVLARNHPLKHIEGFGLHLAKHFLDTYGQVTSATISLRERSWKRIRTDGAPHPTAFVGGSNEERVCTIHHMNEHTQVESGLEDLLVLKTTQSSFSGFVRDRFTTLPEADDRILATNVSAYWTYGSGEHDWNHLHDVIRRSMLETFARHDSRSVQETLYAMGEAALAGCPEMTEITLELPNSHRIPVNLAPFGLDNPNEIFVPTDEPFGIISGTLTRR